MGVWVEPEVVVTVSQQEGTAGQGPRVRLEASACRLKGQPAPFFEELNSRFALHFCTELTWRPGWAAPQAAARDGSTAVAATAAAAGDGAGTSATAGAAPEPGLPPSGSATDWAPQRQAQPAGMVAAAASAAAAAAAAVANNSGGASMNGRGFVSSGGAQGAAGAGLGRSWGGPILGPTTATELAVNLALRGAAAKPPPAQQLQLQPQPQPQPRPLHAPRPQPQPQLQPQHVPRAQPVQPPLPAAGRPRAQGEIRGDLTLAVWAETPPPFDMVPRGMLESSCNTVRWQHPPRVRTLVGPLQWESQ